MACVESLHPFWYREKNHWETEFLPTFMQGQESGDVHFATKLAEKLGEYEKAWSALRAEHRLGPVRRAPVLEHQGTPDGKICKDYHNKCPWWADKVPPLYLR